MDKSGLISEIQSLTTSIDQLANKDSLATVDHTIKKRQTLIEQLFSKYSSDITPEDLQLLKVVQDHASNMMATMELEKSNRGDEIIKNKNKGQRIRLYTSIAKQK